MRQLVVLLTAVTAIAGGSAPPFVQQSWTDTMHGWATDGGNVYGTENGGRSWHRLLRLNEHVDNLRRTSVRAGFVVASVHGFVTIDAGRHWYFADAPDPLTNAVGNGRAVYFGDNNRLYRLVGWPPRRLRCPTRWISEPNGLGPTPKPHNICEPPPFVHLRSREVLTLHDYEEIFLDAVVPGGVAGLVWNDCTGVGVRVPVTVLVYRNDAAILRTLPPPLVMICDIVVTLTVDWPSIVVTGPRGYWISDNGGDTWRFVG